MSKRGEWDAMGRLITDEMVHEFAIVAPPDQVAERLLASTAMCSPAPASTRPTRWATVSGSRSRHSCRLDSRLGGQGR